MAKTGVTKRYFNFIGGKHSDGSALVAPENTARTMINCDLATSGKISRRLGLDFEANFQDAITAIGAGTLQLASVGMYEWFNVDQSPNATYLVVRIGFDLYFFNEGANPVSSGLIGTINFQAMGPGGIASSGNDIQVASGKGLLFITGDQFFPFFVKYDPVSDDFSLVKVRMNVRDFEGVEDGLAVDDRPSELSQAHAWNLSNQGWDTEKINLFRSEQGRFPSNADIMQLGFTVDNTTGLKVWKSSEILNTNLGGTPAPKGKFILDPFTKNRLAALDVSAIIIEQETTEFSYLPPWIGDTAFHSQDLWIKEIETLVTVDVASVAPFIPTGGTLARPKAVSFYAGRAWYASVNGEIYFSQIITSETFSGRCYQEQDPTAEDFNELVDTDGGVIQLAEAGDIVKLIPGSGGLIVLATNGIWKISGGETGFTANNTFVTKVSSIKVSNGRGVVEADGTIFFWSEEGIYALTTDQISGNPVAKSLSAARIERDYNKISISAKSTAQGAYDRVGKKIYWSYNDGLLDVSKSKARYNAILIYDLVLNAFYDYRVSDSGSSFYQPFFAGIIKRSAVNEVELSGTVTESAEDVTVNGEAVTATETVLSSTDHPIILACFYPTSTSSTSFRMTFGEFCSRSFHDWKGSVDYEVDYTSVLETNPETLNEGMMDKQATWLYSYYDFQRDGFGQLENDPRFEAKDGFRVTQHVIEVIRKGIPLLRGTQHVVEVVRRGVPNLRATQHVIEVIRKV